MLRWHRRRTARTFRKPATLRSNVEFPVQSGRENVGGGSRRSELCAGPSAMLHTGIPEEVTVRSTFVMRFTGLLFAALALALSGCGTVPEGLGVALQSPALDISRTAAAGEAAPLDARLAGAGQVENLTAA